MRLIVSILLSFFVVISTVISQGNDNLIKVIEMNQNEVGFPSICSENDTLMISYYRKDKDIEGLYWYKNNKKIKSLDNLKRGEIGPNGNYYSCVKDNVIHINNDKDITIAIIPTQDFLESMAWSYDSKTLYICEQGTCVRIYSYDIATGAKEEVIRSKKKAQYSQILTVKNKNVIYFLENRGDHTDPIPICDIIRYDLSEKNFTKIVIPKLINFNITTDFTISPNEKIIMFNNIFDGNDYIYVINNAKVRIIDKIKKPIGEHLYQTKYSWKLDSSYVIFTITGEEIFKYTIPKH